MSEYSVFAHPRVQKAIKELTDEALKGRIIETMTSLANYPLSLRELDVQKLEGLERTFRVRIGQYRLVFHVSKRGRLIFVAYLGKRESIYEG